VIFQKLIVGTLAGMLSTVGAWGIGFAGKETAGSVPLETVVDYIHAVLEADRTFYTVHVVERMQRRGVIETSENWRSVNALPLPAQFFQESSGLAALTGVPVQYRLTSLFPINQQNLPATEFDRTALEAVMAHPHEPYKGFITEEGVRRFRAVYADIAVSPICASCHNAHPASPKRDYKLNDVLGAVVITIPAPE
jgi:hypothetical protein